MNIAIVALAHNSVGHIDRFLMSLHSQFYTNWHLYIVDIDSEDKIEDILESLRYKPTFGDYYSTRNCDIFKDRISYFQISFNQEEFQHILREVLKPNPLNHLFTFIPSNWKFNGNVLEHIAKYPTNSANTISLLVNDLRVKDPTQSSVVLNFYKRSQLESENNGLVPMHLIRDEHFNEFHACHTETLMLEKFGRAPYVTAFPR